MNSTARHLVLVVEDNPDLRRQLQIILEESALACIVARNEIEGYEKLNDDIFAVVADIDLSETGGQDRGGIILAEQLAILGTGPPVILISQTPWAFLPSVDESDYEKWRRAINVVAMLDRNDVHFWAKLIDCLRSVNRDAHNQGEKP